MTKFNVGDRVRIVSVHVPSRADRTVHELASAAWHERLVGRVGTVSSIQESLPDCPPGPYYGVRWDDDNFVGNRAFQWEGDLEAA